MLCVFESCCSWPSPFSRPTALLVIGEDEPAPGTLFRAPTLQRSSSMARLKDLGVGGSPSGAGPQGPWRGGLKAMLGGGFFARGKGVLGGPAKPAFMRMPSSRASMAAAGGTSSAGRASMRLEGSRAAIAAAVVAAADRSASGRLRGMDVAATSAADGSARSLEGGIFRQNSLGSLLSRHTSSHTVGDRPSTGMMGSINMLGSLAEWEPSSSPPGTVQVVQIGGQGHTEAVGSANPSSVPSGSPLPNGNGDESHSSAPSSNQPSGHLPQAALMASTVMSTFQLGSLADWQLASRAGGGGGGGLGSTVGSTVGSTGVGPLPAALTTASVAAAGYSIGESSGGFESPTFSGSHVIVGLSSSSAPPAPPLPPAPPAPAPPPPLPPPLSSWSSQSNWQPQAPTGAPSASRPQLSPNFSPNILPPSWVSTTAAAAASAGGGSGSNSSLYNLPPGHQLNTGGSSGNNSSTGTPRTSYLRRHRKDIRQIGGDEAILAALEALVS